MNPNNANRRKEKDASTAAVKRAYDAIKADIIDFAIMPGERINEVELAGALGMSRAPVREALNRLVEGGFVFFDAGKGFFCRKFSASEIADLFEIRLDLETAAVRKACVNGSAADIASILESWRKIAERHLDMSIDQLIASDEIFHMQIAALAGNAERMTILTNINERIRFVRKISIESESRRNSFVDEHLRLIAAIARQDQAEAVQLIEYHLDLNAKELKANIHEGLSRIYAKEIL